MMYVFHNLEVLAHLHKEIRFKNVHFWVLGNNELLETTQISIRKRKDKQIVKDSFWNYTRINEPELHKSKWLNLKKCET